MVWVIYEVATSKMVKLRWDKKEVFKTEAAAKTVKTRICKTGRYHPADLKVVDFETYNQSVRKTVTRVNLMTGEKYEEDINTPGCCSPSTETYWSM